MRQMGGKDNSEIHGNPSMEKPNEESLEERNLTKSQGYKGTEMQSPE